MRKPGIIYTPLPFRLGTFVHHISTPNNPALGSSARVVLAGTTTRLVGRMADCTSRSSSTVADKPTDLDGHAPNSLRIEANFTTMQSTLFTHPELPAGDQTPHRFDLQRIRYKDFPPGWGHLMIPTHSRAASLSGLSLFTPCTKKAIWFHRTAWVATKIFGHIALPGRVATWTSPLSDDAALELTARVTTKIGEFDSVAGYKRMQPGRRGFALLLLKGSEAVGFLKLREDSSDALRAERQALLSLAEFRPRTFTTPTVIDFGTVHGWQFLLTTALTSRPHRVPDGAPIMDIVSEIDSALSTLPKPSDATDAWRPMHGDFTPWNLRRTKEGRLILFDWEDASWGPEGADEVLFRATDAAVSGREVSHSSASEAISLWRTVFTERLDDTERETRLSTRVLQALAEMEA